MEYVKDMPLDLRPREKALHNGVESLSDRELLALLIRTGIKGKSVLNVADEVLSRGNGINGISMMSVDELCVIPGISKVKAIEIKACLEIARRAIKEGVMKRKSITRADQVAEWLQYEIGDSDQEHFLVMFLDAGQQIIRHKTMFVGGVREAYVDTALVLKEALQSKAVSLILVHNHPSGFVTPSDADIQLTARIQSAASIVGITVIDHIIVGKGNFFSFLKNGLITPA